MKFIAKPFYQISFWDTLIRFNVNGEYTTTDKKIIEHLKWATQVTEHTTENRTDTTKTTDETTTEEKPKKTRRGRPRS